MVETSIVVELVDGRHRARLRPGHLRPLLMSADVHGCTVGLVATGALLLGGDDVRIRVDVGPGARLDLRDIAGTVAHDGRGVPSRWDVEVTVGAGGALRWGGEPFVVADGALVSRSLRVEASGSAQVSIRETLVLGRSGEIGGRLANRSEALVNGATVYREDLDLLDPEHRSAPGMLGGARVMDSLLQLGPPHSTEGATRTAGAARTAQHERDGRHEVAGLGGRSVCDTFLLAGGAGSLTRFLGDDLAPSLLHQMLA